MVGISISVVCLCLCSCLCLRRKWGPGLNVTVISIKFLLVISMLFKNRSGHENLGQNHAFLPGNQPFLLGSISAAYWGPAYRGWARAHSAPEASAGNQAYILTFISCYFGGLFHAAVEDATPRYRERLQINWRRLLPTKVCPLKFVDLYFSFLVIFVTQLCSLGYLHTMPLFRNKNIFAV